MLSGTLLLLVIFGAIVLIVLSAAMFKIHPFIALIGVTILTGLVVGMPAMEVLSNIEKGFGNILGSIGIIVVLGSIIGVFLDRSGGALKIADLILSLTGKKHAVLGMAIIGAIVSIPVFCDSGFIILVGLSRSLAKKAGKSEAALALALAGGLYTTHTLVPPTPGPIAVAGNLGAADYLGLIMLVGLLLSIPCIIVVYIAAKYLSKNIIVNHVFETPQIEEKKLPPTWQVSLPILVPILLITIASVIKVFYPQSSLLSWSSFLGHPIMALLVGLLLALPLTVKGARANTIFEWTKEGVWQAGPILLLTGAGGAFGNLLRATPLSDLVAHWVHGSQSSGVFFLITAYAIAALLKTAQGSTTSSLVITSSILATLAPTVGFDSPLELAFLAAAIGAGGMAISHVNDSFFWVISQFSGINTRDTLRSFSLMTLLQSFSVLLFVLVAYVLFF